MKADNTSFRSLAALAIACWVSGGHSAAHASAADDGPQVVYRWDAANWLTKFNPAQFNASAIKNADGSDGARVVVTQRSSQNPYNHLIVTNAGLQGGKQYTAAVNFTVNEATKFPTTFYMYARNSAGNQYDIWMNWIGLPGETRTITLPLDLKQIEGGKWTLAVGIGKSGGLDIHSITVFSGTTSDGKTSFVSVPAASLADAKVVQSAAVTSATGSKDFTITPPAAPTKTISLSDYGLKPDSAGDAATIGVANAAALQKALNDCKAAGATTLDVPTGVFRITSPGAITFDSLTDVTIDGHGATLMFDKLSKDGPAMMVRNCSRMVMRDINFDWDNNAIPIASLGTVSNLSADRLQCDITFPDLTPQQVQLTAKTPWKAFIQMDPAILYRTSELNMFRPQKGTQITPGATPSTLHVVFPAAADLENGKTYAIRHMYYEMSAFKAGESRDVSFQNVSIFSMPGMGWFFSGGMQNLELLNCHIYRPAGRRDPLTTAADGIHVDQYVSNLRVEGCAITGCGDDAMNIHSESYQGDIVTDPANPAKITLMNCPSYLLRLNAGDPVEFYNSDYSNLAGATTPVTRKVASTKSNNQGKPQTTEIEFTEPLPSGVTAQSILANGRFQTSNLTIRGCKMYYTNGRGILVSSKNVTIEKNEWDHVYASAINLESDIMPPLWSEGRGCSNVLIRDNVFANSNQQVRYNGAMIYCNTRMPYGQTTAMLYDGISIENNRFVNLLGPIALLSNISNLSIKANDISAGGDLSGKCLGGVMLSNASNTAIIENKWTGLSPNSIAVLYDPATTTAKPIEAAAGQ